MHTMRRSHLLTHYLSLVRASNPPSNPPLSSFFLPPLFPTLPCLQPPIFPLVPATSSVERYPRSIIVALLPCLPSTALLLQSSPTTAHSKSLMWASFRAAAAATSLLSRAAPSVVLAGGGGVGTDGWLPAHQHSSGEQFWLKYSLDCPIQAKAVLVEFYADGHYIGAEGPMADGNGDSGDSGLPTIRSVESSIRSQYGRDNSGKAYQREVFFSLVDAFWGGGGGGGGGGGSGGGSSDGDGDKHKLSRSPANALAGTVEVKVYRVEKTGEWNGAIVPCDIPPQLQPQQQLVRGGEMNEEGISHTVRLGASMPAEGNVRCEFCAGGRSC